MKHIITSKNTTVTDAIRMYIEKRFAKFDKYAPNDTDVYTKIEVKDNGNRHKVEVTISFGKQTLRAEENSTDMYTAIDNVEKTMSRLLKKRKEKNTQRYQQPANIQMEQDSSDSEYQISRIKMHKLHPMTVNEACEAMEMVGHPFYIYIDVETNNISAVYMRDDGTYGQLVYE